MPPYTQNPLGAFLATLGQGIPALAQQHRERGLEDVVNELKQRQVESQLKSQGLQQQLEQENLNDLPVNRARATFNFQRGIDPVAALLDGGNMKAAGLNLQRVPPSMENEELKTQMQGDMLRQMQGGSPAPPAAAPGAPPDQSGNPFAGMSPIRKARMLGLITGPELPQELAENAAATKGATIAAEQQSGQLPAQDTKFVDDAMTYYSQIQNAAARLADPTVQKAGMPGMQWERMKYKLGIGNSAPYDQIIPTLDMGKQQILSDLSGGIRNAQVRHDIGQHLPGSEQSPIALKQRLDNIIKYYPYMVYSKYAARGVRMPESVIRGMGYDPQTFSQYINSIEATKPESVGPGATMSAPAAAGGGAIDAHLKAYADTYFGGDINAARAAAGSQLGR